MLKFLVETMKIPVCHDEIIENMYASPLHKAACNHHFKICDYLLENGVDVNEHDRIGRSVLYYILCFNRREETAMYLLDHGADPNLGTFYDQSQIIRCACGLGMLDLVRKCIEMGDRGLSFAHRSYIW